jgi:small-conductance mechanosensitive channel
LQLLGFTLLARALTRGSISFAYLAPVILISAAIVRNMVHFLEQSSLVRESALARKYYAVLYTIIKGFVIYLLFYTLFTAFSLKPAVYEIVETIWNFGGTFGEFTISVGDVLGFFFIVFISWLVSVLLQVILEGEILARFDLRRGVAMAVGILARYSVMVLGFLAAVASTGFDINKISILAGALGVGIGFALQNLVANFISGLVIIFERPFVVNDIIRSADVEGSVKEIGIRASKILTYAGAEVIIPNAELISSRVTNFTLSNKDRRHQIIVRTAIEADPAEVIRIIMGIAQNHEFVLKNPAPVVSFEGQSEQSLQFHFYYWIVSEYFKTRTDLNSAILRELKSIGVELPLHVVEVQAKTGLGSPDQPK